MDYLLLGGVVLVLTIFVYILATLGTKETPFEQAIAAERQKREQENAPPPPAPKQERQKFNKKPKKTKVKKEVELESEPVKAATEPEPEPEPEPESKHESTPIPVEPEPPKPSPQPVQDKKKDKKNKKEKEDKKSKADKVDSAARKTPVVEKVEEIIVTKAETSKLESKKPEAAPEPSPPPQTKETKKEVEEVPVKRTQIEVIETVEAQVVQPVATGKVTPTQEKREKKKKDKSSSAAAPGSATAVVKNETKLVSMVQQSPLSGTEIQTLIDILLNKQQQNNEGGEWVEKGRVDPTTQLRKQLEEVEVRLKDKDEAHSALTAKITDLRAELNGERSRAIKYKSQLDETIAANTRQLEIATTNAQTAQVAKLNELRKELEQEFKNQLDQQKVTIEQLQSNSSESEITTLRASLTDAEMKATLARQEVEEKNNTYEEHIKSLKDKLSTEEVNKNAQITELHTQLANSDAARAQALAEMSSIAAERDALTVQVQGDSTKYTQLQHKLQETVRDKSEVESRYTQIESELSSVRQIVLDQTNQIERLKEEKESLATQSVRPAAEGQENGDVHAEQSIASDTTHLESLVKEKENVIEEHLSELKSLNKEITRLKEELESQRTKNNEVSNSAETEQLKVRAVLKRIFPDIHVDDSLDQEAFMNAIESQASQVATQTTKSEPEVVEKIVEKLVEKEVKVMVEDPELKSKVEELSKENSELKSQVEQLKESIPKEDNSGRISELEEEVKTVNEKVIHYQKVLADTESLLTSLQASVESEESSWKEKLTEKDKTVKQLTADKANLELQMKQLEGTLDQVKKAEEMESQLKNLQEQLHKEEKEKSKLLEQLQEAQEELTKTTTEGGSDENEQELRTENEKLKTLISVGQDASREQDQLIEQLQKELASVKNASTNGPVTEQQCHEAAEAN